MIGRILAVVRARNTEFLRDRSTLIWNLVLPMVLALGLAVVFSGAPRAQYKVLVLGDTTMAGTALADADVHPFLQTRYIDFIAADDRAAALDKLEHHQVDMVLNPGVQPSSYWVNSQSPAGDLVEKLLLGEEFGAMRQTVSGEAVRYIDWLFPGILGMNLMFSCLFGVGYVVVRYRKSGFLKRLSATPLRAVEFVVAQILSRLMLVIATTVSVFALAGGILNIQVAGSVVLLFLTLLLGAFSLISIGFLVSSRVTSEELAGGLLNVLSWPMMMLSGVWFSLEGKAEWLQLVASVFPLTHLLQAARGIMLDGHGLAEVLDHWLALLLVTVVCLAIGSYCFRWRAD